MKIIPVLFCVTVSTVLFSCKKDKVPDTVVPRISPEKTTPIRLGEPVMFSMSNIEQGASVDWTLLPGGTALLNAQGTQASVVFKASGSYTLTGRSGAAVTTVSITVTDNEYNQGNLNGVNVLPLLPWETIQITAAKESIAGKLQLALAASTGNRYICSDNSLGLDRIIDTTAFTLQYHGVMVQPGCYTGATTAQVETRLFPVRDGVYDLIIQVNGTDYKGTIEKKDGNFIITWPDTSVVNISPLTL